MDRHSGDLSARGNKMNEEYTDAELPPPKELRTQTSAPDKPYQTRRNRQQQATGTIVDTKPRTRRTLHNRGLVLAEDLNQQPTYIQFEDLHETIQRSLSMRLQEMADDFKIVEEFPEGAQHLYMRAHKSNNIPIGDKCQAELPAYIGRNYFNTKIQDHLNLLGGLLVSEATTDRAGFSMNLAILRAYMGDDKTEQELAMVLKAKQQEDISETLDDFLKKNKAWLPQYLQNACPKRPQKRPPKLKKNH